MQLQSHPVPRSALLFMAAVEEARKTHEGPFRAIAPLFRVALEHQRGRLLDVGAAAAVLAPVMGDTFSDHALEAFLPQLRSLGWLIEEPAGPAAAYRVPTTLPELNDTEALEASEAKLSRLYIKFTEFLERYAPLLRLAVSEAEFKWEIFRWATSLDGTDKDALNAEAARLLAGGRPSIKAAIFDETKQFSGTNNSLSIEFAGFTKWLSRHAHDELTDLAALTEMGLALEFLQELRQPTQIDQSKLANVFVLDAPVLLDLMGLSGPSRQDSIENCLRALRAHGARVATLTHCLEELSEIIDTVLRRPVNQRFGLTGDALRANPSLSNRARFIARSPDKEAKRLGVEVLVMDRKSPLYANFFPDDLIDRFRLSSTWHGPDKVEQQYRDALSVAFVMRRRQGRHSSDAFEAPFTLITRNSTFTRYAELFVKTNLSPPSYAFGPAMETKTLAAITWMRFGDTVSKNAPEIHLISACDRILASNGYLLRKAERRLAEQQSKEVSEAIFSSQQAVLDLVVATGGSPDVLDAANSEELLQAVTSSAQELGRLEERRLADAEIDIVRQAASDAASEAEAARRHAVQLAADKVISEGLLRATQQEVENIEIANEARLDEIAEQTWEDAEKQAWWIVGSIWIAAALYGLVGQFFIWDGDGWWRGDKRSLVLGSSVILASLFALVLSLRFVPPGRIDGAGLLHATVSKWRARALLQQVRFVPERNRVHERLERLGHL